MTENKFYTPLRIGLFVVVLSYFLFTLHATFVLNWIGEWKSVQNPQTAFMIMITDISAGIFLVFRFISSLLAFSAVIYYFAKKGLATSTAYKLIRWILVFEALYWIGLLPSGIWGILPLGGGLNTFLLLSTGIPCMVGSIGIPVSLFMLAYKLSPNKPAKGAIKWALIAGIFYALALWLNNAGMWIITVMDKGVSWLFASPQSIVSFVTTEVGLLLLAIFTIYFAKKSFRTQEWSQLKMGAIGALITALGLFYLWNYLTWIFFGGWNEWYAWILGHNLDLWMLALPLLGLSLLFKNKDRPENSSLQTVEPSTTKSNA